MSDAGDLLEPILRFFGRIIGWIFRLLIEIVFEVLVDGLIRLGDGLFNLLRRWRCPKWIALLLALIWVITVIAAPIALLIAILRFATG